MKYYLHLIGIIVGIFGIAFALGMTYEATQTTCPVLCDNPIQVATGTVSIFEVDEDVRDAYCNIRNEPVEIPRYITVTPECEITECDCTIDAKDSWDSCMRSYESVTSNKRFNKKIKMREIDDVIRENYPQILDVEQYTQKLVDEKTLSLGAIENYSALFHELYLEICHGTQTSVMKIVDELTAL
jgi:hypothetical protein